MAEVPHLERIGQTSYSQLVSLVMNYSQRRAIWMDFRSLSLFTIEFGPIYCYMLNTKGIEVHGMIEFITLYSKIKCINDIAVTCRAKIPIQTSSHAKRFTKQKQP